jgi:CheY-like chemotaxis protein
MARILIVDDDLGIRALLAEILGTEGYEILQAANGAQAVELARAEQPDLILMDLMMPVLDGAEAMAILKRDPRTRDIRIIAMSAGRNLHHQVDDLLADSFLAKPFELDTLLADVALHLRAVIDPEPFQMAWD